METLTGLFTAHKLNYQTGVFVKSVSQDLKDLDIKSYDMIVFYNPADVKSLQENFPEFRQEDLVFVTYGPSTAKAMKDAGLEVAVPAPTPEARSIAEALAGYLESAAKQ